jgi:hypothetical protein
VLPHWAVRGDYFESSGEKMLYMVLLDRTDAHGYCHPSLTMLAHDTMTSRRSVIANLTKLETLGVVERFNRSAENGEKLSNEYHVSTEVPMGNTAPTQGNREPTVGNLSTYPREPQHLHKRTIIKNQVKNHNNTPISPQGGEQPTFDAESPVIEEPITQPTEAVAYDDGEYTPEFEMFWAMYPLHQDKRQAFKAYKRARRRASAMVIAAGAQKYAHDPNLPEPRYIKHAATWLNADGWANDPLPSRTSASGHSNRAESTFNNAVNIAKQFYEQEYGSSPQDMNLLGGLQ